MAKHVVQLVNRLQAFGQLPEDRFLNVLNVTFPDAPPAGDVVDCCNAFRDFFIVDSGAGQAVIIGAYISEVVQRTALGCQVDAYVTDVLDGSEPMGSPVATVSYTLTNATNASQFPEEVAVALSIHGDVNGVPQSIPNPDPPPAVIRPAQRRRGRIYIGPLGTSAGTDGAQSIRPSSQFRTDLAQAFVKLCTDVQTNTAGDVCVWSKADADTYALTGGFIDDAWDTQRRRGLKTTARTTFVIV